MQHTSEPNKRAIRQYSALANSYDSRFAGFVRAVTTKAVQAASLPDNAAVLDVGCGTGEVLLRLAQSYPSIRELSGIDLSAGMLDHARTKLHGYQNILSLQTGTSEALPYDDNHFDLIVTSGMLHYLDDPTKTIQEMIRVLRPGGRILVMDLHVSSALAALSPGLKWAVDPGARRFHTVGSITRLLNEAGMRGVATDIFGGGYIGLKLYSVTAAKPMRRSA